MRLAVSVESQRRINERQKQSPDARDARFLALGCSLPGEKRRLLQAIEEVHFVVRPGGLEALAPLP
jgi:hypothetical protein